MTSPQAKRCRRLPAMPTMRAAVRIATDPRRRWSRSSISSGRPPPAISCSCASTPRRSTAPTSTASNPSRRSSACSSACDGRGSARLGTDVAGTVEAVGPEVRGSSRAIACSPTCSQRAGVFAEYVAARRAALRRSRTGCPSPTPRPCRTRRSSPSRDSGCATAERSSPATASSSTVRRATSARSPCSWPRSAAPR